MVLLIFDCSPADCSAKNLLAVNGGKVDFEDVWPSHYLSLRVSIKRILIPKLNDTIFCFTKPFPPVNIHEN